MTTDWTTESGTSFAAPLTAGAAALLLSEKIADLDSANAILTISLAALKTQAGLQLKYNAPLHLCHSGV